MELEQGHMGVAQIVHSFIECFKDVALQPKSKGRAFEWPFTIQDGRNIGLRFVLLRRHIDLT